MVQIVTDARRQQNKRLQITNLRRQIQTPNNTVHLQQIKAGASSHCSTSAPSAPPPSPSPPLLLCNRCRSKSNDPSTSLRRDHQVTGHSSTGGRRDNLRNSLHDPAIEKKSNQITNKQTNMQQRTRRRCRLRLSCFHCPRRRFKSADRFQLN